MQSPITNTSIARSINAGVGNVDEVASHIELGYRLSPPSVRCVNTKSSSFTAAAGKASILWQWRSVNDLACFSVEYFNRKKINRVASIPEVSTKNENLRALSRTSGCLQPLIHCYPARR
jgi:hypothetical protein